MRAPGKTPRDLLATAENLLAEAEQATETNEAYFGKSWTAHCRYAKRLHDDLGGKIQLTKDMGEHQTQQRVKKHAHSRVTFMV